MFNRLKLTNFRKHRDLVINFTAGVNAIRSPNESGKSTVLEALAYAMFGAKALKEALADVVTYGLKESELKVELSFTINSVEFLVKRSKSGAELVYKDVRVTGQTEVTKFVESLLGVNADTASKLMLAKQSSVTGALSEGSAGLVRLIETLANFDLVTKLVDLIQEKLPSGNTIAIEQQILEAEISANEQIPDNSGDKRKAVESSTAVVSARSGTVSGLKATLPNLSLINERLQNAINLQRMKTATEELLLTAETELEKPMPEAGNTGLIAEYERNAASQKIAVKLLGLKQELDTFIPGESMDLARIKLEEKLATELGLRASAFNVLQGAKLEEARVEQKLIKDTTCALCGKDLIDVPEVVANNSRYSGQLVYIKSDITKYTQQLSNIDERISRYRSILSNTVKLENILARCDSYVEIDSTVSPARYRWTGPTAVDTTDFSTKLMLEKNKQIVYATEEGRRKEIAVAIQGYMRKLDSLPKDLQTLVSSMTNDREVAVAANVAYEAARSELIKAEKQLEADKSVLAQELAVYAEACKRVDRAKVHLANLKTILREQKFNNAMVKKLRLARPQIADRLWGMVLASVSSYFSAIRGEVSVVTKTSDGFRVNDKPVAGLSGSTQDALGLAIRVAMTKTFLPNSRFLVLDEVASGMDDEREAALLGMVSSCGMDQIILVTHSELADTFASTVITL